jgi:PAS domain S-box-containing protein
MITSGQLGERDQQVCRLLDSQRRVLERIASGAPLEDVLLTLVHLIEAQAADMRCTVLLADTAQTRLRFVATSRYLEDLRPAMEPHLRIGQSAAPCASAAHLKQPVYTRDLAGDALWPNIREVMARFGVRAVWSTPIIGDDNRVLGTFAMYYTEPRLPSPEHVQLIEMAVQLARVTIEAMSDEDLLRNTFDNAPTALVICDADSTIVRANRAFSAVLGYTPADLRGRSMAEISEGIDEEALVRDLLASKASVAADRRYRHRDGGTLWARERASARFDQRGKLRYVVTRIDHLSDVDPLVELSSREREVLELVVAGRRSKQIAKQLGVSVGTVDTYRARLMLKLGLEDLPSLVRFAIRHGISTV